MIANRVSLERAGGIDEVRDEALQVADAFVEPCWTGHGLLQRGGRAERRLHLCEVRQRGQGPALQLLGLGAETSVASSRG